MSWFYLIERAFIGAGDLLQTTLAETYELGSAPDIIIALYIPHTKQPNSLALNTMRNHARYIFFHFF